MDQDLWKVTAQEPDGLWIETLEVVLRNIRIDTLEATDILAVENEVSHWKGVDREEQNARNRQVALGHIETINWAYEGNLTEENLTKHEEVCNEGDYDVDMWVNHLDFMDEFCEEIPPRVIELDGIEISL
jgi:hypothetical protein